MVKGPAAAALNTTLMVPFSEGLTGVFVNSATEQPQVGFTSEMIMGESPVLVKTNSWVTGLFCGIRPKSWDSPSN